MRESLFKLLRLADHIPLVSGFPLDKRAHFVVSFVIAFIFMVLFQSYTLAVVVTCIIGLGKEIYDEYDYGGFSLWDLIADAIGCVAGLILAAIVLAI